jgi:chemotaxis protein MotB
MRASLAPFLLCVALITPLASGCVPAAKYQKVVDENSRLNTRIDNLQAKAQARLKALKDLLEDLKPLIDRGLLSVEIVDGRVVIGMTADVLFPSGSATLSSDGKRNIGEVAQALKRRHLSQNFQIEGHTDNDPINTPEFPDNWHLGAARAITVLEYMVDQGFPSDRISAATFGETQPVAPNSSGTARGQNRRIEIVVLPDLNDLPGSKQLLEAVGKAARPRGTGGPR